MKILSKYMCILRPIASWNMVVIKRWKATGALQSPIHMMWLTNVPVMVANAFFSTSSGRTRTCSYASVKSIFERYFAHATSSWMTSWSGKGVTSFTILSFRCRASNTVLNFPSFLGIHRSGAACVTDQGSYHPDPTYWFIFAWSSSCNEFGQRGVKYLYCLLSSTRWISWLTSLQGGSWFRVPLTMSANSSCHYWRRRGKSSLVKACFLLFIFCERGSLSPTSDWEASFEGFSYLACITRMQSSLSSRPSTEDAMIDVRVRSTHSGDQYRCLNRWGRDISPRSAILNRISLWGCLLISYSLMADTISFHSHGIWGLKYQSNDCCGIGLSHSILVDGQVDELFVALPELMSLVASSFICCACNSFCSAHFFTICGSSGSTCLHLRVLWYSSFNIRSAPPDVHHPTHHP